jgi:hypothetical protein
MMMMTTTTTITTAFTMDVYSPQHSILRWTSTDVCGRKSIWASTRLFDCSFLYIVCVYMCIYRASHVVTDRSNITLSSFTTIQRSNEMDIKYIRDVWMKAVDEHESDRN